MADEGIRLPSDSTVASQKIHRGSGSPEGLAAPANKQLSPRPTPLMTVVLKSTPILIGEKEALYEVLLQNDPKSNPPIVLTIDTEIKPGTSLLLVLDKEGNYQPVEKPTQDQLRQLIKLELEFWRAHLMPQANLQEKLKLPSTQALLNLATTMPALKPLVNFLVNRPTHITANHLQQVLSQFKSIVHPPVLSTPPLKNAVSQAAWPVKNKPLSTAIQTTFSDQPITTAKQATSSQQSIQVQFSHPLVIKDFRLSHPVGTLGRIKAFSQIQEVALSALTGNNRLDIQRGETIAKLQFAGQIYQLPEKIGERLFIPPEALKQITFTRVTQHSPSLNQQTLPTVNLLETTKNSLPIPSNKIVKHPATQIPNEQLIQRPVTRVFTELRPRTTNQTENPLTQIRLPDLPMAPSISTLLKAEQLRAMPEPLPIELRLSSWLQEISTAIKQHPTQIQADLKHKAEQALQSPTAPLIENSLLEESKLQTPKASTDIDNALIQLRSTLETTLARIQHAAVQTATQQWSTPDQPVYQQHLPLIWLGLTHWADIEWWQEKKQMSTEKDKKTKAANAFKMRIFLTLEPLQEICAEIETGNHKTHLTFWTEDQTTLAHLHSLLPKLEQWTEGLGERHLQTKHGLPLRKSQAEKPQSEQHLVDVRT